ncbi:MAG TPA: DUF2252 domain-containing protein [Solirubrobacter sp.]|nr:DUF2252 domain-containing protein [Solirubrobacter sp.]
MAPAPAPTPTAGRDLEALRDAGRQARKLAPRRSHGVLDLPAGRDPLALLRAQDANRIAELIPVRYGRMLVSPFALYRGSAAVMAADLAPTPVSGITVQACGDAHLLNFGAYASPERRVVFDVNDFDETQPGPWEWDVKRLAASFVIAARDVGLREDQAAAVTEACVSEYRRVMDDLSEQSPLEVFYTRVELETLAQIAAGYGERARKGVARVERRARRRTSEQALDKLGVVEEGGELRIGEDPPLIQHIPDAFERVGPFLEHYERSLPPHIAHVLTGYHLQDVVLKVVGVGSVGLQAYVALFVADAGGAPLFLQVKQAVDSVLAPHIGGVAGSCAKRVVDGQRMMQTVSDPFLGWVSLPDGDFYVRQFRDMKASVELERSASWFTGYAQVCGGTLARAHARSAHPALIAGYLGSGAPFASAVVTFARAYADVAEADYDALRRAARAGRIAVVEGA